jgi:hypothetical protein
VCLYNIITAKSLSVNECGVNSSASGQEGHVVFRTHGMINIKSIDSYNAIDIGLGI